jgi:hypothetical protein
MDFLPPPYKHPNFGIFELYIIASSQNCTTEGRLHSAVNGLSYRLYGTTHVALECHTDSEETHEYHGIEKVWELGQSFDNTTDIVFYFHSKGITHSPFYFTPGFEKPMLEEINRVEEAFNLFPTIDKVGYEFGGLGWIWYNVFYARGSYLKRVERPLRTNRRHYYEDWLGRVVVVNGSLPLPQDPNASELPFNFYPTTLINCYATGYANLEQYPNVGYMFNPPDSRVPF